MSAAAFIMVSTTDAEKWNRKLVGTYVDKQLKQCVLMKAFRSITEIAVKKRRETIGRTFHLIYIHESRKSWVEATRCYLDIEKSYNAEYHL
jgi:hypothetical protein